MTSEPFGINWSAREFETTFGLEITVADIQALIAQEKNINEFVINIRGFNNEAKAGQNAFTDHKTLAICIEGIIRFLEMFDAANKHLTGKLARFMMLAELLDELNNAFAHITDINSLKTITKDIFNRLQQQHFKQSILDDSLLYVATLEAVPDDVRKNLLERDASTIDRNEMLAILRLYNPEMAEQFASQIDG